MGIKLSKDEILIDYLDEFFKNKDNLKESTYRKYKELSESDYYSQ